MRGDEVAAALVQAGDPAQLSEQTQPNAVLGVGQDKGLLVERESATECLHEHLPDVVSFEQAVAEAAGHEPGPLGLRQVPGRQFQLIRQREGQPEPDMGDVVPEPEGDVEGLIAGA